MTSDVLGSTTTLRRRPRGLALVAAVAVGGALAFGLLAALGAVVHRAIHRPQCHDDEVAEMAEAGLVSMAVYLRQQRRA